MSHTRFLPVLLLTALPLSLLAGTRPAPPLESGPADTGAGETRPPASGDLLPLDIRFMARGTFFAKSARRNRQALGGFAESNNGVKRLRHQLPRGRLVLLARPEQSVAFDDRYEGLEVILANTTRRTVWLEASNSRLSIVREAVDVEGRWRPIEYLPRSWCGNSYHRVALPSDHYWSFPAPRYSGSVSTVMRFALVGEDRDEPLYSNEFPGRLNREQFSVKPAYTPTGIMDPYID